jgi:pimeloyl-ACP methyl ester carboxylesterase
MYALAFDYRHFGISDGHPRDVLSIEKELEDWSSALRFARSLEEVDKERVAVWGTSFSGGHVVELAVRDGGIAAAVSQVPMMSGGLSVATTLQYRRPSQNAILVGLALQDLINRRSPDYSPIYLKVADYPFGDLSMLPQPGCYEGYLAAAPPGWKNRVAAGIGAEMGFYNPGNKLDKLNCPILIQIGTRDNVTPPDATRAAAERAGSLATVKEYDVGHFGFYSGTAFEVCVSDQIEFLTEKLTP